ncbi:MAG TPA: hypothetical protein VKK79_25150, partial [Candidatus Lokiarchaeia archaeon]|nr:hypothetical protein [Candidatus Lokiarchaeia archaeon]
MRKREIFLIIYFTLLAFTMANYANNVTASTQTWSAGQQVAYMLPSSDSKHANISIFQIIDINTTTGQVNVSWDARPKESFPFIFSQQNVTDFLSTSTGAGNPPFGTSTFGKKQVQWINKTNAIAIADLNTSYLAYLIQPTHIYYVLIDQNSGIVVQLGDVTDGTILLQLTQWPDQFFDWNTLLITIAAVAVFLIFMFTYRFSMRELRISPRNNKFDKVRIQFSAIMFAGVISAVSLFVITIMLSAIGGNWTLALQFGVQQVKPDGTTYVRPLDPGWQ